MRSLPVESWPRADREAWQQACRPHLRLSRGGAAAALMLQHDPGNYEWVRRVLGHKNIRTTINFYIGLETTQASERFGQIVRKHVRFEDGRTLDEVPSPYVLAAC